MTSITGQELYAQLKPYLLNYTKDWLVPKDGYEIIVNGHNLYSIRPIDKDTIALRLANIPLDGGSFYLNVEIKQPFVGKVVVTQRVLTIQSS
jgi:hypothetical protein